MKLLIKNIRSLVQVEQNPRSRVGGNEIKQLPVLNNAWLLISDDVIESFGSMDQFPGVEDWNQTEVIDATDRLVLPCWCDSHTHIVFAASREAEFVDRIKGLSYEEIGKRGGGILNSAAKMAAASEQDLFDAAMKRIKEVVALGTGAIEIKSGYGLSVEAELKMLRVIKRLKQEASIPVKSTFLGAHAVPSGKSKEQYLDEVINVMLPKVAEENLADYCDIFCERNYFSKADTIRMLKAASALGIKGKVHAEQLSNQGGTQAAVECGAVSVDHLEYLSDDDIKALSHSDTIPTLLPGAQWFLQEPNPPARKMIEAGLPVALASDYNPGSSPSGNMNFMLSLACVQYKMTPEEAINAATINGAAAMGLAQTHGSIAKGKKANLIITKEMQDYAYIPYWFAHNPVETVIINGKEINS